MLQHDMLHTTTAERYRCQYSVLTAQAKLVITTQTAYTHLAREINNHYNQYAVTPAAKYALHIYT
jgi:hypothetical protein